VRSESHIIHTAPNGSQTFEEVMVAVGSNAKGVDPGRQPGTAAGLRLRLQLGVGCGGMAAERRTTTTTTTTTTAAATTTTTAAAAECSLKPCQDVLEAAKTLEEGVCSAIKMLQGCKNAPAETQGGHPYK
jgi:hypothetical protein